METAILICLLVILLIRWAYLRDRLDRIEARVEALAAAVAAPGPAPMFTRPPEPAPEPVFRAAVIVEPPAPPMPPPPPPPVRPEPMVEPAPVMETVVEQAVEREAAPQRSSEDWEALLGGNWLNKLGVFVLVIGIALALAYSYKLLGPAGRIAVSLAISLAMLGTGVVLEQRERYRIFARGLIGGGWAALYFTVYAMQALDAARIIDNPWLGAILLLAVAVGMIVHSLRYRSQAVTGLAYFIAFASLAITGVTAFSLAALIPLAASLLYIARRFGWSGMAVFGLVATYAVCATRPDTGAPLWQAQAIFAVYGLLFEAFDIFCPNVWLLPLNAIGFLGLSIYKHQTMAPETTWLLLAVTAVAYLGGALLRARSGKWQPAVTLSAALGAAAMFLKLEGQWLALGLLLEGEIFYLAGVRLRAGYLRMIGAGLFTLEVAQLVVYQVGQAPVRSWTPLATLSAIFFYANRALRAADRFYGFAAAALLALVAGYEAPTHRAVIWLAMALAPFALGWWRRMVDFRLQGYLLALAGLVGTALDLSRLSLAAAAAVSYGLALAVMLSNDDRLVGDEREAVSLMGAFAAMVSLAALIWRVVPAAYLGVSWMVLALIVLELGMRGLPKLACRFAYALAALGAALSWAPWEDRRIPLAVALIAWAMAARARREEHGAVLAVASTAGTVFAMGALWAWLDPATVAPAWAILALALLILGNYWGVSALRWQCAAAMAVAFAGCWATNFASSLAPFSAGAVIVACLYAAQLLSRREEWTRIYYSLLATTLASLLPYYQVAGSLRTVVWGMEGVVLLASGFPLRERILRLSGLTLLLGCILKLFVWDLRHLDTGPRIVSFLVLGLFLVGVSWVYTRFRERVAQYL